MTSSDTTVGPASAAMATVISLEFTGRDEPEVGIVEPPKPHREGIEQSGEHATRAVDLAHAEDTARAEHAAHAKDTARAKDAVHAEDAVAVLNDAAAVFGALADGIRGSAVDWSPSALRRLRQELQARYGDVLGGDQAVEQLMALARTPVAA